MVTGFEPAAHARLQQRWSQADRQIIPLRKNSDDDLKMMGSIVCTGTIGHFVAGAAFSCLNDHNNTRAKTSRAHAVEDMRDHQIKWASKGNIPPQAFEERRDEPSWVLRRAFEKYNLFDQAWWDNISGKEHRWARALTSSQCFAVNLFGPLNSDRERLRQFLQRFLPDRTFGRSDEIDLRFEHTPQGAPDWLGETGQPTQIDVFFELRRQGHVAGFVLVEVKFTEAGFGSCRGWNGKKKKKENDKDVGWQNPGRTRCQNVGAVLQSPLTSCWLAETEKRHYWQLLSNDGSTLQMDRIRQEGPCPFRHGLYQLMRNRVLADELCRRHPGAWAEVIVCRHPGNARVTDLKAPVAGSRNVLDAFRTLFGPDSLTEWNPEEICRVVGSLEGVPARWPGWMRDRYFPGQESWAPAGDCAGTRT